MKNSGRNPPSFRFWLRGSLGPLVACPPPKKTKILRPPLYPRKSILAGGERFDLYGLHVRLSKSRPSYKIICKVLGLLYVLFVWIFGHGLWSHIIHEMDTDKSQVSSKGTKSAPRAYLGRGHWDVFAPWRRRRPPTAVGALDGEASFRLVRPK